MPWGCSDSRGSDGVNGASSAQWEVPRQADPMTWKKPLMWICNQTKQRILKRMKKKVACFCEKTIILPYLLWNQYSGNILMSGAVSPSKNNARIIHVFIVSHCKRLQCKNSLQKEAPGDTDGSINCLGAGVGGGWCGDHKLCIETILTNEIIIRKK